MNIPAIMINSPEQKALAEKLGVIHNTLGKGLIKVAQMSPRFKGCYGPLDIRYNKRRKYNPEEHDSPYVWEYVQGRIEPADDPFPQGPPIGTGKVMYFVDDEEPTPPTSKSGRKTGYNREFLASHWGEGFKVIDPEQEAEIKERADAIQKRLEMERSGTYQPEQGQTPADEEKPAEEPKQEQPKPSMRDRISSRLAGSANIGG